MANFKAGYTYFPTVITAPAKIAFQNTSSVGTALDGDQYTYAVDANGNPYTPSQPLSTYIVSRIELYSWNFGDGTYSNDATPNKVFDVSGTFNVSLTISSQQNFDLATGVFFRTVNVYTQSIVIGLMTYTWLIQHMTEPQREALTNSQAFNDLITSVCRMFDRMYQDIKNVADLMDIQKTPVQFLQYFSETLNHEDFYAEKIGYAQQPNDNTYQPFLEYNIFDRISKNIASEPEILEFRKFITDTAALFKRKGSKKSIEDFFKLYNFMVTLKDMWTDNFGTTPPPPITNYFFLDPTLQNTESNFQFRGISATGLDNSFAQFSNNNNNFLIDNYHFLSTLCYPSDATPNANCTQTFLINDYSPNIKNVVRDDGRTIDCLSACPGFDIVTPCASAENNSCRDDGIVITENDMWMKDNNVIQGATYKIWNAPTGYVQSLVNTLGLIPNTDTGVWPNDAYFFANWKSGVTIPPTITGVSNLNRPNANVILPIINYGTTLINNNLLQTPLVLTPTTNDFFMVVRGLVEISTPGFYTFTVNIGNTGSGDGTQHLALLSLQHTQKYTSDTVKTITNLDNVNFIVDNTQTTYTYGTTATGMLNINSQNGEYAVVEIRQNQQTESSTPFLLDAGYYVYELKTTYSSLVQKNIILSWEGFIPEVGLNNVYLDTFIANTPIPSNSLFTANTALNTITDNNGKGLLIVPNDLIEGGDIITVSYADSNSNSSVYSGIISTNGNIAQDLEMNVRFSLGDISPYEAMHNATLPQNTIMLMFRGINRGKDLYATIDTYYAVILNGLVGEVSLAEVSYSSEVGGSYFRYLNLNPDLTAIDQRAFTVSLLDENGQTVTLSPNQYYDFKIQIQNNRVNVYFRNNAVFTDAVYNIEHNIPQNLATFNEGISGNCYTTVISGATLTQKDADTQIFDSNGNYLYISEKYNVNNNAGAYGLAIQSSIFNINKFFVKIYDLVDTHLLETVDKWQQIKPKYLDYRPTNELQYNSYDLGSSDRPVNDTFDIPAVQNYNGTSTVLLPASLGQLNVNDVSAVTANSVSVSGSGTRFNVLMDENFINGHFDSVNEILESLYVQFGNVYEPFINWSEVESVSGYSVSFAGGFTPFINQTANVLPHTVSVSANTVQYFSEYERESSTELNTLVPANQVLNDFLNGTSHSSYSGFWEEVCPLSVNETWTVNGTTINNPVFEPIYRDVNNPVEVIGVRFVSTSVIDRLICRYCLDTVVYGLYQVTLPVYATQNQPVYNSSPLTNVTTMNYFVPIGKLNEAYVFMLPPPEILRNTNAKINLLGVYALQPITSFSLVSPSSSTFLINSYNPYENDYKSKITCNYFIALQTSFVQPFTQSNVAVQPNESTPCNPGNELVRNINNASSCPFLPNTFYMPAQIQSLLVYLQNTSSDFLDDYNYWAPKNIWIKRPFKVSYPTNTDTEVFGGLNAPNAFYTGATTIEPPQGTTLTIEDNNPADMTNYVVDTSWCASSVGWDAEFAIGSNNSYNVGVFSPSAYAAIGFDASTNFTMGTESLIPLGNTLNAPIPLQTVNVSGDTSLLFGSYLVGENGPGRSFIPVGLYNWFLTHANPVNDMSANQRAGWELTDFNDEFVNCVSFNGIYGQIPTTAFSINQYWSFLPNEIPPFGSIVRVVNSSKKITLGVSDGLNAFYQVPVLVQNYPKWYSTIQDVIVDNYVLPDDYYSVDFNTTMNVSQLNLNTSVFDFTPFYGSNLVLSLYFDKLYGTTGNTQTFTDDFNTHRTINWLTYVDNGNYYQIATRQPDTELKYTSDSLPYNITNYNNTEVYQLVDKFDYTNPSQFAGELTNGTNNPVGIVSNHGSINVIQLCDIPSNEYTFSCDVIFDEAIVGTDLDKSFELILKADNKFLRDEQDFALTDFYFVGINTYEFDIGLGMQTVDISGNLNKTYLASYGQFNARDISADTWYTLQAKVSTDNIKIYFFEQGAAPELVLTYNINKSNENISDRYLLGEFENLQAIVVGLQELGITYPATLGNTVSSEFTFENFKQAFAATLPIKGTHVGFRTFNNLTYVTNVNYTIKTGPIYQYGSTYDGTSYDTLISRISNRFGLPPQPNVVKFDNSLNFTVFVLINDSLFYQYQDNDPQKYHNPVDTFYLVDDKIIIVEKIPPAKLTTGIGLNTLSIGNFEFTWVLSSNSQNIVSMYDFFNSVPNLTDVYLQRGASNYHASSTLSISGDNIILQLNDVITLTIGGSRSVIWPLSGTLGVWDLYVRAFEQGFTQEYPILIKDNTFYQDDLPTYMDYTEKKIREVIVNDKKLHILFEDL